MQRHLWNCDSDDEFDDTLAKLESLGVSMEEDNKTKIYNCADCDYCYSNETMGDTHICVNGNSEYLGEAVDWLGLAGDDMACVVVAGKDRSEIKEEAIL